MSFLKNLTVNQIPNYFIRNRLMKQWPMKLFPSTPTTLSTDYFPSVIEDGEMVKEYHKGLIIDEGVIFTPENRCKGMMLLVYGDLVVNGTISMTARGANAPGDDLALDYENGDVLLNPQDLSQYPYTISKVGGTGAPRVTGYYSYVSGKTGSISTTYGCGGGGGGAGAAWTAGAGTANGGAGGAGTSYSGGAGGGGASCAYTTRTAGNGAINGGAGGNGIAYDSGGFGRGGGGGAGNPGGLYHRHNTPLVSCSNGETGTGGLLIIMVKGNIIIGPNGIIESNGSAGGYALNGTNRRGAGGGGSGGGSINVLYNGSFTNNGTIQANGGMGGDGTVNGGNGGAGTVRVEQVIF